MGYTSRGGNAKLFLPPSEKGFTLKGKNCFLSKIEPFSERLRSANRNSQDVGPFGGGVQGDCVCTMYACYKQM